MIGISPWPAICAAYFNFSNRVNSALGVVPNAEPFGANR
jgi:hypothetical protein